MASKGQRLFHCIKEMTKIIKKSYLYVHKSAFILYIYVTGLVTRQILFDKYNCTISLSEEYTAFPFFV